MRLFIYLDGDFAPYWKWRPYWFRRIGWAAEIIQRVESVAVTTDKEVQARQIEEICDRTDTILSKRGLDMEVHA